MGLEISYRFVIFITMKGKGGKQESKYMSLKKAVLIESRKAPRMEMNQKIKFLFDFQLAQQRTDLSNSNKWNENVWTTEKKTILAMVIQEGRNFKDKRDFIDQKSCQQLLKAQNKILRYHDIFWIKAFNIDTFSLLIVIFQ